MNCQLVDEMSALSLLYLHMWSIKHSCHHFSLPRTCCSSFSGLFEQRVEQYLEELPDTEQSGMNKFLRGLGKLLVTNECSPWWRGGGVLFPKIL